MNPMYHWSPVCNGKSYFSLAGSYDVSKVITPTSCLRNAKLNGSKDTSRVNSLFITARSRTLIKSSPEYSMSKVPDTPSRVAPLPPEVKSPSIFILYARVWTPSTVMKRISSIS